jgi:hypothetical protein
MDDCLARVLCMGNASHRNPNACGPAWTFHPRLARPADTARCWQFQSWMGFRNGQAALRGLLAAKQAALAWMGRVARASWLQYDRMLSYPLEVYSTSPIVVCYTTIACYNFGDKEQLATLIRAMVFINGERPRALPQWPIVSTFSGCCVDGCVSTNVIPISIQP